MNLCGLASLKHFFVGFCRIEESWRIIQQRTNSSTKSKNSWFLVLSTSFCYLFATNTKQLMVFIARSRFVWFPSRHDSEFQGVQTLWFTLGPQISWRFVSPHRWLIYILIQISNDHWSHDSKYEIHHNVSWLTKTLCSLVVFHAFPPPKNDSYFNIYKDGEENNLQTSIRTNNYCILLLCDPDFFRVFRWVEYDHPCKKPFKDPHFLRISEWTCDHSLFRPWLFTKRKSLSKTQKTHISPKSSFRLEKKSQSADSPKKPTMFSPRSNDDVTPTERNPFDADISELLASKENWSSTEKGGGQWGDGGSSGSRKKWRNFGIIHWWITDIYIYH